MANELVLVVDDEPEISSIVARVLERGNYRVLVANSGAEALRVIENETAPLELVVTDLVMPGIGGRELAWRLQQLYPAVRVILLSGYADGESALQMMNSSEMIFLEKPIDIAVFSTAVRDLLDGHGR